MRVNQRWIMIGAGIGLAGGAVSLALSLAAGSVSVALATLLPGTLAGGFTAALVTGRILHRAAVQLNSLAESVSPDEQDALGHRDFDDAVEKVHEVLDRARDVQVEL